MAIAIVANAIVFHTRIEGKQNIPTLATLTSREGTLTQDSLIQCWHWVVKHVNYWPIFRIASKLLAAIPAPQANPIIKRLLQTANDLTQIGATRLNDLSGRMFQKLISDRKFLATFYTLPVSATLLADLAVARLPVDWGDPASVKALRVGDLACGTGTLLGAAYHAIRTRVRRAGCNDEEIHSAMIEQALFASDITIVSIANAGATNRAFSADTGMAEVLVVAVKRVQMEPQRRGLDGEQTASTVQFANLRHRPQHQVAATETAKSIAKVPRHPGHGTISIGNRDSNGSFIHTQNFNGGCAGLMESGLAQVMSALANGRLLNPRTNVEAILPISALGDLGERGPIHRDIIGPAPRGPFDKASLQDGDPIPTYPALWRRNAEGERRFMVSADTRLLAREGQEEQAAHLWARAASCLHLALDLRLNSQSLAACLTEEKTLGGRAWPNFVLSDSPERQHAEKAILLWFNSTLGLMSYWWLGTRQQAGRTVVTISALPSLMAMDTRSLDRSKFAHASQLFDHFAQESFLPANECYRDTNRIALDDALLFELLEVPRDMEEGLNLIRRQWCSEPSVHGGKATRP